MSNEPQTEGETMTTTHTPGPWMYRPTAGQHDFAVYPEATGHDVALVRDFNEANARLIAAAPDLLAALRRLHDVAGWDDEEVEAQRAAFDAAIHTAQEVIAKAAGS